MMREKDPISGVGSSQGGGPVRPGPVSPPPGFHSGGPNDNPIMQAASPLLYLLGLLRSGLLRAPAAGVTPHIAAALDACESDMIAARISRGEVETAKNALRATAEEVLSRLPGEGRDPPAPGLAARPLGRSDGGRGFFMELGRVTAAPKGHAGLLELFHACLALGFQGPDQSAPGGDASLQNIRRGLFALVQKEAPEPPPELSPRWRSLPLPSRAARLRAPFWAAAGLVGLLLFGVFLGLRVRLGARAEAAAQALASLNPPTPVSIGRKTAAAPPPPWVEASAELEHIKKILEPDIAAGALSLALTANAIVIRIPDAVLFQPGRTNVRDEARPLLTFIALALDAEAGAVKITGDFDQEPGSNARFATNFELSLDRAKAVGALLKQTLSHPERVAAAGETAEAPIAAGAGEGSGKTRGIEIITPRGD